MFSLKSLFVGVAIAGLGAAGLIHRTRFWASAVVGVTVCLFVIAVFRTWFVTGDRAFWGPFAVTSAVYLGIVSLPPLAGLHFNLPTTQLVVYGMEKIPITEVFYASTPSANAYGGNGGSVNYGATGYGTTSSATLTGTIQLEGIMLFSLATTFTYGQGPGAEVRVFLWVAQCLWCLLLSALAGMACSWVGPRRAAFMAQNQTKPIA